MRINRFNNKNGPALGICAGSNLGIIEQEGLYFKDIARNGELLPCADWRLDPKARAQDLAKRMTIEQIAGLMLYSSHQSVPAMGGPFPGTYNGKSLQESGAQPSDLTDQQLSFLQNDHIRYVLLAQLQSPRTAAEWNNNLQALAESLPLSIPVNISSDPRHGAEKINVEYKGGGGQTSKWPEGIAMAATFDPSVCEQFAQIASKEYRAMGIATALSPQVDLATEPRWMRFGDTFGEHKDLTADMGRAYCDGMQSSDEHKGGWGNQSVAVMSKHWPGGGSGEAGRDAHYAYGKYAVYPGKNFDQHLIPFTEGVFKLNGATKTTASIMPYYTISFDQSPLGENVGNAYSKYMISDLLREKYGFDGVVCTDWGITGTAKPERIISSPRCWGTEMLNEVEQHLKLIENGVDQFGGNNKVQPILDAYKLGCERHGEAQMRARMEQSATRLLLNTFRCGLFEDPYLCPDESANIVGCDEHNHLGMEAQIKSIALLKNKGNALPLKQKIKVYVPGRKVVSHRGFFGFPLPDWAGDGIKPELLSKYFEPVDAPELADAAIVIIETPISDAYSEKDIERGGNGYLPISLQYAPYKATEARETSIAGGDPFEDFTNRSYKGKTAICANEQDLKNVIETRARLKAGRPLIVVAELSKPTVLAEIELHADAIVAEFGISMEAVFQILCGNAEPSGLLPMRLPMDMDTVEQQMEDVPFDMVAYRDELGNAYDFGFGLNWSGKIKDERTEKYKV